MSLKLSNTCAKFFRSVLVTIILSVLMGCRESSNHIQQDIKQDEQKIYLPSNPTDLSKSRIDPPKTPEVRTDIPSQQNQEPNQAIYLPIATYGIYYECSIYNDQYINKPIIIEQLKRGVGKIEMPAGIVFMEFDLQKGLLCGVIPTTSEVAAINGSFYFSINVLGEKLKFVLPMQDLQIYGKGSEKLNSLYDEYKWKFNFSLNPKGINISSSERYSDRDNQDLEKIFRQERLSYDGFKNQVDKLSVPGSKNSIQDSKINSLLHLVWFTNKTDPEDIKELFKRHNPYIYDNIASTEWKQKILWVNNPEKIPSRIRNGLIARGLEIQSFSKISSLIEKAKIAREISNEESERYQELYRLVYFYIEKSDYGSATDIARYLIMFLYGGIYVDGDYKILDIEKLKELMVENDSFFGIERAWDTRLGNAFLASKKYGMVIKGVLDLTWRNSRFFLDDSTHPADEQNHDLSTPPAYVKNPSQWDIGVIFRTGPIALTVAWAKHHDEETSKMLEYCSIFQINCECRGYRIIGQHDFAAQWAQPE